MRIFCGRLILWWACALPIDRVFIWEDWMKWFEGDCPLNMLWGFSLPYTDTVGLSLLRTSNSLQCGITFKYSRFAVVSHMRMVLAGEGSAAPGHWWRGGAVAVANNWHTQLRRTFTYMAYCPAAGEMRHWPTARWDVVLRSEIKFLCLNGDLTLWFVPTETWMSVAKRRPGGNSMLANWMYSFRILAFVPYMTMTLDSIVVSNAVAVLAFGTGGNLLAWFD